MPTTVKNPQVNGIIKRVHGVINDMLRTKDLDNFTFDPADPWGDILANVAWALHSLTHSTLNATPGQLVFSRDMLFDLKHVADILLYVCSRPSVVPIADGCRRRPSLVCLLYRPN